MSDTVPPVVRDTAETLLRMLDECVADESIALASLAIALGTRAGMSARTRGGLFRRLFTLHDHVDQSALDSFADRRKGAADAL